MSFKLLPPPGPSTILHPTLGPWRMRRPPAISHSSTAFRRRVPRRLQKSRGRHTALQWAAMSSCQLERWLPRKYLYLGRESFHPAESSCAQTGILKPRCWSKCPASAAGFGTLHCGHEPLVPPALPAHSPASRLAVSAQCTGQPWTRHKMHCVLARARMALGEKIISCFLLSIAFCQTAPPGSFLG